MLSQANKRRAMNDSLNKDDITKIITALIKKAVGYNDKEVIEEYVLEKDELKLVKKRVTKKFVPPDLSASKLLLEYFNIKSTNIYENMSDSELDAEADRLYEEYQRLKDRNLMVGLPKVETN